MARSRNRSHAGQLGTGLAVESIPLTRLKPDPRNPRKHPARQVQQIARSIEAFGFNVPVLADAEGRVIAGHGRLLAAEKLGLTHVPVIRLEHLDAAQLRAFQIADNKLTENAGWDEDLLAVHFQELSAVGIDLDLDLTGFSAPEVDRIVLGHEPQAEPDPADAVPPAGPAVSQAGDLWQLGPHRLLCGDALDPASYAAVLGPERARMIFTDPPYNVPIDGHVSGLGKVHHRDFAMATGEMSEVAFAAFLKTAMGHAAEHSLDGALQYWCMDWRSIETLLGVGRALDLALKNLCVWVKTNAGMGSLYRSRHELVAVFKAGTGPHLNNVELGRHGRHRTNVWEYASPASFGRAGEEGRLLELHPTVKPVALVADALLDASARGDLVLDPFLGSGTTLIAAERVHRRLAGIEIDPLYVDTAIRRWRALTGEDAVLAATGQTFTTLEQGETRA
jgi:16S rRNA G966 N2-methylase RsmD